MLFNNKITNLCVWEAVIKAQSIESMFFISTFFKFNAYKNPFNNNNES